MPRGTAAVAKRRFSRRSTALGVLYELSIGVGREQLEGSLHPTGGRVRF